MSFTPVGPVAHQVVRLVPFTFRRRIAWGDSDSARIVYTGRFLDFMMDAGDAWWQAVIGYDWHALHVKLGRGAPAVHVDLDFSSPVAPGDELDCIVTVGKLGGSSLGLVVAGEVAGRPCFTGNLVSAFVTADPLRGTPLPPAFRECVEAYQRACAGA